jgi:hypothetical protein
MKHPVFFPFYNIYSELVKTAIGLKDTRSIDQFFKDAGVEIRLIGKKKCVTCEDLLNVLTKTQVVVMEYVARTPLSRKIEEME